MSVERMSCCGALTKVYGDAGNRRHNPGCLHDPSPYGIANHRKDN